MTAVCFRCRQPAPCRCTFEETFPVGPDHVVTLRAHRRSPIEEKGDYLSGFTTLALRLHDAIEDYDVLGEIYSCADFTPEEQDW